MSYLKLPQFFTHLKTTDNCVSETIAKVFNKVRCSNNVSDSSLINRYLDNEALQNKQLVKKLDFKEKVQKIKDRFRDMYSSEQLDMFFKHIDEKNVNFAPSILNEYRIGYNDSEIIKFLELIKQHSDIANISMKKRGKIKPQVLEKVNDKNKDAIKKILNADYCYEDEVAPIQSITSENIDYLNKLFEVKSEHFDGSLTMRLNVVNKNNSDLAIQLIEKEQGNIERINTTLLEHTNKWNKDMVKDIITNISPKNDTTKRFFALAVNENNGIIAKQLWNENKINLLTTDLISEINEHNNKFAQKLLDKGFWIEDITKAIKVINADNIDYAKKLDSMDLLTYNNSILSQAKNCLKVTNKTNKDLAIKLCERIDKSSEQKMIISMWSISDILSVTNEKNLDFVTNLLGKENFSLKTIRDILWNINDENIKFAAELCNKKDFPQKHISDVIENVSEFNINLATKLCNQKNLNINDINDVLRRTKSLNLNKASNSSEELALINNIRSAINNYNTYMAKDLL